MNKCVNPECGWEGNDPRLALGDDGYWESRCPKCGDRAPIDSIVFAIGDDTWPKETSWLETDLLCPICKGPMKTFSSANMTFFTKETKTIMHYSKCEACRVILGTYEE